MAMETRVYSDRRLDMHKFYSSAFLTVYEKADIVITKGQANDRFICGC
jgi:uncharacterized protein with ATP-grasp and redox domains